MSLILRKRIAMLTPAAPAGFSVAYYLTNVTSSNTTTNVSGVYTSTLTASDNISKIRSVTITMDGIDITSTAYSNGNIYIQEVTGDIEISATATLLPVGYTRLQYILNSNRTYIDTGVYLQSSDHVIANFGLSGTVNRDRWLFGSSASASERFWADAYHYSSKSVYPRFGSNLGSNYATTGTVEVRDKIWYFANNRTYDCSAIADFVCTQTCKLFGRTATESYNSSDLWISRFYIEGKFDGYACLDSNNVAGMYDIISESFFKSPDDILFVAGPIY